MKFPNYFLVTQTSTSCFKPAVKVIYYPKDNFEKLIQKFKYEKKKLQH